MKRRSYLKNMAVAGVAAAFASFAETASKSIQLHVDLSVDPAKESKRLRITMTEGLTGSKERVLYQDCAAAQ